MFLKKALPLVLSLCAVVHAQTVYLAGDSTMASGGGGSGTDGEYRGEHLASTN